MSAGSRKWRMDDEAWLMLCMGLLMLVTVVAWGFYLALGFGLI